MDVRENVDCEISTIKCFIAVEPINLKKEDNSILLKGPTAVAIIVIPHATSCGRYNVFYPSVSQSVSP